MGDRFRRGRGLLRALAALLQPGRPNPQLSQGGHFVNFLD
jgi:hypothetical protein